MQVRPRHALAALAHLALLALVPGLAGATTVGIVGPDLTAEPVARAAKAAQAQAEDKGWTVALRDAGALPDLVGRKLDGLILVMLRPEAQAAAADAARKAGVPIVTVLAGASPQASLDVTVNQYAIGAESGAYLLGAAGYRGRVLMLRADADPGARARARVVDLMLQDAPGVQVVGNLQRAPGGAPADEVMRRGLEQKLPPADAAPLAVWAATDEAALLAEGVLKGKGYGRDRAVVVSVGGSEAAFGRLRDGGSLLAATVAIPYELLGQAAVDALDDLLAGTPRAQIATGSYLYVDPVLVDRNNAPGEDELPW